MPKDLKPRNEAAAGKQIGWIDILDNWALVVPDLAEFYGVDLYDPALSSRTWPWLRGLIYGLLSTPASRLARALHTG